MYHLSPSHRAKEMRRQAQTKNIDVGVRNVERALALGVVRVSDFEIY